MEMGSPVIIISAFGRGHWLAAALVQEGIKTTLVDVTAKLGVWPVEDAIGPFGFFRTDGLAETKLERLYAEDAFQECSNGFTIWAQEGPLEFKGPLTKFKIEKLSLSSHVREFFLGETSSKQSRALYKNIETLSFDQSWLLHLSHQLASTTYASNALGASVGDSLPLFSSFLLRQPSRNSLERSFEWLKSKGVDVLQPHQIVDASFGSGKVITGLELSGENQGLFRLDQIVWMLSSEESYFLNERLARYFYPEGPLEPDWCWVRYRLSLQGCFERDHLPLHTVVIQDIQSPWVHENLMVLQRTSLADQFDVWIRIPNVQRFNKDYLTTRSELIKKNLSGRMPLSAPEILSFPQEYYYTYAQLGPSRFPVFSNMQSSRRGKSLYRNLYLDGPEIWANYSYGVFYDQHELIRSRISSWWKEKLLKEQKENRREQKT